MSFRCQSCQKAVAEKVSPVSVFTTRSKEYLEVNENGEMVQVGVGDEIDQERFICPACAGIAVKPSVEPDYTSLLLLAKGYDSHTRTCPGHKTVKLPDGTKEQVPCSYCQRIVTTFESYPLQALSLALQDKESGGMSVRLAAVVMENLMDRTTHRSQRAHEDCKAAIYLLKEYEQMGGGL